MQRAYSVFTVQKATDDGEERLITGIASTPEVDRGEDIVEPDGVVVKLPIPLLWQHDPHKPIGQVISRTNTKDGIQVVCRIAKGVLPYIDEAWALIKAGLVRGFSIGFDPIEWSRIEGGYGRRFLKWEWLELSAVTIPMNASASIQTIKSIDQQVLRERGHRPAVHLSAPPGLSGKQMQETPKGNPTMKTIQEQIAAFEAKRAATAAIRTEVMAKANDEGRSLDAEEAEKFETAGTEIKDIDAHLGRLREMAEIDVSTSTAIVPARVNTPAAASEARGGAGYVSVKSNLPIGTGFARYVKALALSKGNLMMAHNFSKAWKDTPLVERVLKAAMDAGTTTDATWASPLVEYQTLASEFIDILRPETIIGRMQGLRRVPFNIRVGSKTQSSTVGWTGQGAPKPVSELAFNAVTLGMAKAAGIVVITQELARSSSPAAEEVVRNDLRDSMVQFLDEQFISPSVAAVADVSPASITNGLTPVPSTGITIAAIDADVASAFGKFITAGLAPNKGVWIMNPMTALKLSLKRTSQDIRAYPDISLTGGTWYGLPVLVSASVPVTVSGGAIIVLADATEIFMADDGGVVIDVSEQASLQMNSTPSAGAQSLVSLWQNNLIGVRAERFINWDRRRDAGVTYIDGVML
jgi:HK97 family phage major capsid protein/HK97 family phage prohead protease